MVSARRPRRGQGGYTYLMLLFAVAALGALGAAIVDSAGTVSRREKEAELLFVGNQYREALRRYHEALPEARPVGPATLEELLFDRRFPVPRPHLRALYADPLTGRADWVLVRREGRIVGVHSRSTQAPLKSDGFTARDAGFRHAATYADWRFDFLEGAALRPAGADGAGPPP